MTCARSTRGGKKCYDILVVAGYMRDEKKNLLNILPLRMMQLYDFNFQVEIRIREMFSAERKLCNPRYFLSSYVLVLPFIIIFRNF
jgi:hypothetical protein